MYDEATGAEPKVISASFAEPYILLIRDDFAATVLKADEESELDEVERGEALSKNRWVSGSLYEDSNDVFRLELNEEDEGEGRNVLAFLLNREGELKVRYIFVALGVLERRLSSEIRSSGFLI